MANYEQRKFKKVNGRTSFETELLSAETVINLVLDYPRDYGFDQQLIEDAFDQYAEIHDTYELYIVELVCCHKALHKAIIKYGLPLSCIETAVARCIERSYTDSFETLCWHLDQINYNANDDKHQLMLRPLLIDASDKQQMSMITRVRNQYQLYDHGMAGEVVDYIDPYEAHETDVYFGYRAATHIMHYGTDQDVKRLVEWAEHSTDCTYSAILDHSPHLLSK